MVRGGAGEKREIKVDETSKCSRIYLPGSDTVVVVGTVDCVCVVDGDLIYDLLIARLVVGTGDDKL